MNEIKKYISKIQKVSNTLAYLDVISSYAVIAEDNNFIKPVINKFDIKWVNEQNGVLEKTTLKILADRDIKYVTMLHGTNGASVSVPC